MPSYLSEFLVSIPNQAHTVDDAALRRLVVSRLYYCATDSGSHIRYLFPGAPDAEIEFLHRTRSGFDPSAFSQLPESLLYHLLYRQSRAYSHLSSSACARHLLPGEPVYRCEQCGYDSSCVLCTFCFVPEQHVGHNVTTYVASHENSGLCDCGDPEAFPVLCNTPCKCQQNDIYVHDPDLPVDTTSLDAALDETISICIQYLIDVLESCIHTLPLVRHSDHVHLLIPSHEPFPAQHYGDSHTTSPEKYFLLLHNDEHHDVPSAAAAIISAANISSGKANKLTHLINDFGCAIIKEATCRSDLLDAQFRAESDGLVASIVTAQEWRRIQVINAVIFWLHDICQLSGSPHCSERAKTTIARVLITPGSRPSNPVPTSDWLVNTSTTCMTKEDLRAHGLLLDGSFIPNRIQVAPHIMAMLLQSLTPINIMYEPAPTALIPDDTPSFDASPLQYLLIYHIRLNKQARIDFTNVLLAILMRDPATKETVSRQLLQIYPSLLESMASSDREEDLSVLTSIPAQLFTCPSTVRALFDRGELRNLLAPLALVIETYTALWCLRTMRVKFDKIKATSTLPHMHGVRKSIELGFAHLHNVLTIVDPGEAIDFPAFILVILVLRPYQSFWELTRKFGEHVLEEIPDYFVHFSHSVPLCSITRLVAELKSSNLYDYGSLLLLYLEVPSAEKLQHHRVSKNPTSLVNPLHSLLSFIWQARGLPQRMLCLLLDKMVLPLRSIVLGHQIKARLWLRNGMPASKHATVYFGPFMNYLTYFRSVHFCQAAVIFDDPAAVLQKFTDVWELSDWLADPGDIMATTYEDHFFQMVDYFMVFLYTILVNRDMLDKSPSQFMQTNGRNIAINTLCERPLLFSEISLELMNLETKYDVEIVLEQVADFQSPSSLSDTGVYRLKPELYEKVNPYNMYADPSVHHTLLDAITRNIAKIKGIDESEVLLTPTIESTLQEFIQNGLARFFTTTAFAKLVYKFMQLAIDTRDETFLPTTLHLLHAVSLSNEQIGLQDISDLFVQIPVCKLLFTVANSDFSKSITNKAKFLLNLFVRSNHLVFEDLVATFGEDSVLEYMQFRDKPSADADKKRAAEKRCQKIMKKLAKQRKSFMTNNGGPAAALDTTQDSTTTLRVCVQCGEKESTESSTKMFGLLARKSHSCSQWFMENSLKDMPNTFKTFEEQSICNAKPFELPFNHLMDVDNLFFDDLNSDTRAAKPYTTCGHAMHYECFLATNRFRKDVACPLCHNFQNSLVPSFIPKTGQDSAARGIFSGPINDIDLEKMGAFRIPEKAGFLSSILFLHEYQEEDFYNMLLQVLEWLGSRDEFLQVGFRQSRVLCDSIADTVSLLETSTRLEGDIAYSEFLDLVPGSAYALVRSLVQARALLWHSKAFKEALSDLSKISCDDSFWAMLVEGPDRTANPSKVIINLFFQSNESLSSILNAVVKRCVEMFLYQFAFESTTMHDLKHLCTRTEEVEPHILETLRKHLWAHCPTAFEPTPQNLSRLYYSLEILLLPVLRQVILFQDILQSTCVDENSFEKSPAFAALSYEIKNQSYLHCSDALFGALGLPSLREYIVIGAEQAVRRSARNRSLYDPSFSFFAQCGYPGVPQLINLPEDHYLCFLHLTKNATGQNMDLLICLKCGTIASSNDRVYLHSQSCKGSTGIFYRPRSNEYLIVVEINKRTAMVKLSGPYLTKHGEVKTSKSSQNATLCRFRYEAFNRLWVNQGVYGLATRSFFSDESRGNIMRRLMEEDDDSAIDERFVRLVQGGIQFPGLAENDFDAQDSDDFL